MSLLQLGFKARTGRISLCLILTAALAVGIFWFVPGTTAVKAMAIGQVTSEKSKITAEEILARFPKEKHEEFMRRAIANSRNLLKSFELWSGIAAHEPIW